MYETGNTSYAGGEALGPLFWLIFLGLYFYVSFAQYKIAQKVGLSNQAWWGFVPILNVFLFIKCANRDWYWFFFLLVPIVNVIVGVMMWLDITKRLGQNALWAILTLIPFLNLIAIGVIAFGKSPASGYFPPRDRTPSPKQPTNVT